MCVDIMSHLCMCFKVTSNIILGHISLEGESENAFQRMKIKSVTVASTCTEQLEIQFQPQA